MLLLALLLCGVASSVIAADQDVIVLDRWNITSAVADGSPWLIKFYAPWCGHCKRLAPVWKDLAGDLSSQGVRVAQLNGDEYPDTAARFGIQGYPTIFHVSQRGSRVVQYQGGRQKADLAAFAKKAKGKQLNYYKNPYELPGKVLGYAAYMGVRMKKLQEDLLAEQSYPLPVVIGMCVVALFAFSALVALAIVFCLNLFERAPVPPKAKDD